MDKEHLNKIRAVKITTVLGIQDDGRKHFIRCPLHGDRTPSFVIYPDNSWCCFGCNQTGQNAIDLLVAMGGSFIEAVKELERFI